MTVIPADENIFKDLGFTPEEAINLKIRSDLIIDLCFYIQEKGWTLDESAEFFCTTPIIINNLINGELDKFNIDQLIYLLSKTGKDIKIQVFPKIA